MTLTEELTAWLLVRCPCQRLPPCQHLAGAGYRASVPNVYLCDSGTHPGPGVSVGSGRNAFKVIAGDLRVAFPG